MTTGYIEPEVLEKVPSVDFQLADARDSDVTYYLYQNDSQKIANILTKDYIFPECDRNRPLKILMHGFTTNVTSPWYNVMKNEYFLKGGHNVIYIDWSPAGNKSYLVSAANTKPVGEFIADFIIKTQVPFQNIHIIGHSLGSHLAGFVGKSVYNKTGNKIGRITATDPGGPGFCRVNPEDRLCDLDATFVDCIHTDVNYYGILKPIGHADFYVNGGKNQPGCPPHKVDDNCSHARSNTYFAESINKRNVMAISAKLTEDGAVVPLAKPDEVEFGEHTPIATRGIYSLKTNAQAPYLRQERVK